MYIIHIVYVFALMGNIYSRWPAMVEEDPGKETYYEMGNSGCIPVRMGQEGDRETC